MGECNIRYGVLADSLGYRIRLAEVASMQAFGPAFEGTGLTAARFTALELVGRNPGIGPARLAAAMAVEPSNVVALVRWLAARGWLHETAGASRREKSLQLTETGRLALNGFRRRLRRHDRALGRGLDAGQRQQLARLLQRLITGA